MGAPVSQPDAQRLGLDPMQGWSLALSAGAAAAGWALVSPLFAGSVALGALLEAANFRGLRRHCERIFFGAGGAGGLAATAFGLRFALLGAAVAAALHAGAHPVGLLAGLSMIVPAALAVAWRHRPAPSEAEALDALPADDPSWDRWSVWLAREVEVEDEEGDAPGPEGREG